MAKIYKFPSGKLIQDTTEDDTISELSDECVNISQFLMEIIETVVQNGDASDYSDFVHMNFREETFAESRDMFVVVNFLNAMFNRYAGIPHVLHKQMDKQYVNINYIINKNNQMKEDDTT